MSDDTRVFDSGAVRSSDVDHLAYDKVSPIGLRRLAARYAHGMETYGPWNYLLGIPASNIISHMIAHIEKYRAGDRTDDHPAALAWGAFTLMHYEETRPHLMDIETYPLRSVNADGSRMEYPPERKKVRRCYWCGNTNLTRGRTSPLGTGYHFCYKCNQVSYFPSEGV